MEMLLYLDFPHCISVTLREHCQNVGQILRTIPVSWVGAKYYHPQFVVFVGCVLKTVFKKTYQNTVVKHLQLQRQQKRHKSLFTPS